MDSNHCPEHTEIASHIAVIKERVLAIDKRINGSIDAIHEHIEHGHRWRMSIAMVATTLIINIIIFAYCFGQLNEKVSNQEYRLKVVIDTLGKHLTNNK